MVIRVQKAKAHWDYTPCLLDSVEKMLWEVYGGGMGGLWEVYGITKSCITEDEVLQNYTSSRA